MILQNELHWLGKMNSMMYYPRPDFPELVVVFEYAIANPSEESLKMVADALEKYNDLE